MKNHIDGVIAASVWFLRHEQEYKTNPLHMQGVLLPYLGLRLKFSSSQQNR